jgi:PleD family two-component response regulator
MEQVCDECSQAAQKQHHGRVAHTKLWVPHPERDAFRREGWAEKTLRPNLAAGQSSHPATFANRSFAAHNLSLTLNRRSKTMANVLCTGVDEALLHTRKLILETAGHEVTIALGEQELTAACVKKKFDVVVVGQTVARFEKLRIFRLVRECTPTAKVLELYSPATGRFLPDADDWLVVPADVPADLATRVSTLAQKA